jgi:peptidoglycan/xylan/chitin deacetylase (PgdA/CDA1 family)
MGKSKPKDVIFLRRLIAIFLCLCFVAPVYAHGEKYVALTFDDGPSGRFTRNLLDGLAQRDVKATFLLCGYRLRDYPREGCRIWAEGHEIGLHGYSHDSMKNMSRRTIAQELIDTEALLPEGCHPAFLRPPGGFSSDAVQQVAQARGLAILHWSVDPQDWETHNKQAIEKAVLQQVKDGDIILLHDMTISSVEAALEIVDELLKQDYEFVTVSELARLRGIRPKPGTVYKKFPALEKEIK